VAGPVIAVTLCGHERPRCTVARDLYLASIVRAGGEPLRLDPSHKLPDRFDALCLTGGDDIDPARYGDPDRGSTEIDPARDELEFALTERAIERDVPILGICRGFQVLNVAFGGSLEQHREGHSPKHPPAGLVVRDDPAGPEAVQHTVTPLAGSLLARACGEAALLVNSSHHQVVTTSRLAPGVRATAWVDDLVEALESPSHRWVVGVQWHPERVAQVDPRATRIFEALVTATEGVRV
jgi:putative glutamine amidotransferase